MRAVTSWVTNQSVNGSLCSFLWALHNPFLFSLDLTSSVEKEFFFMIQTRGEWNPSLAKWCCYLGKDSCTPSQQRKKFSGWVLAVGCAEGITNKPQVLSKGKTNLQTHPTLTVNSQASEGWALGNCTASSPWLQSPLWITCSPSRAPCS